MCQLAVAALALVQPRGSRLHFCLNGALKRVYQFLFATRRKEICKYVLRQFSTAEKKIAENFSTCAVGFYSYTTKLGAQIQ